MTIQGNDRLLIEGIFRSHVIRVGPSIPCTAED